MYVCICVYIYVYVYICVYMCTIYAYLLMRLSAFPSLANSPPPLQWDVSVTYTGASASPGVNVSACAGSPVPSTMTGAALCGMLAAGEVAFEVGPLLRELCGRSLVRVCACVCACVCVYASHSH